MATQHRVIGPNGKARDIGIGPTADRDEWRLTSDELEPLYLDTDLGKLVVHDGTTWRDAPSTKN